MGLTPGQIGGIAGGLGDLFQGIAGGIGDLSEAKAYKKAQKYSLQNAVISQEAGDIKLEQTNRAIYRTIGAQKAGYAAAGLTGGGSAQEVLRSSVSQGALEKAIVNEQTQINVIGYQSQAAQFAGMAAAAKAAGAGSIIGGIFSAAAEILPVVLASDRRLKRDIEQIDWHGKLGIYRFRFIGDDTLRVGVMADEVAVHAPYALGPLIEGYSTVDYGKLGLAHLAEM
jgi:hypothetical protein